MPPFYGNCHGAFAYDVWHDWHSRRNPDWLLDVFQLQFYRLMELVQPSVGMCAYIKKWDAARA